MILGMLVLDEITELVSTIMQQIMMQKDFL